jgi:hypothetical protein
MIKSYIQVHARGSGRSTRLLEQVIDAAMHKKVIVICHSGADCRRLQRDLRYLVAVKKVYIKFEPSFKTPEQAGYINWQKRTVDGHDEVFIDHHVWAEYFGFAIEGFHEYDNQVIVNPRSLQ